MRTRVKEAERDRHDAGRKRASGSGAAVCVHGAPRPVRHDDASGDADCQPRGPKRQVFKLRTRIRALWACMQRPSPARRTCFCSQTYTSSVLTNLCGSSRDHGSLAVGNGSECGTPLFSLPWLCPVSHWARRSALAPLFFLFCVPLPLSVSLGRKKRPETTFGRFPLYSRIV